MGQCTLTSEKRRDVERLCENTIGSFNKWFKGGVDMQNEEWFWRTKVSDESVRYGWTDTFDKC